MCGITVALGGSGQCQSPISGSTLTMTGLAIGGVLVSVTLGAVGFFLTYSYCKRVSCKSAIDQQSFLLAASTVPKEQNFEMLDFFHTILLGTIIKKHL